MGWLKRMFGKSETISSYEHVLSPADLLPIQQMDVALENGQLTICGTDELTARLTVTLHSKSMRANASRCEVLFGQDGQDHHAASLRFVGDPKWLKRVRAHCTIHWPSSSPVNWSLQLTNGPIHVNQLPIQDQAEIKGANGPIHVEQLTGNCRIHQTNGSIKIQEAAGDVEVSTINGSITVHEISRSLQAQTVNGSITVSSSFLLGIWDLQTTNGRVHLTLSETAPFSYRLSVVNGSLHSSFPGEGNQKHWYGTQGMSDHKLNVKTINGSIHIGHLLE